MNVPIPQPTEPVRGGSIALGFGLAWLTMIVGYVLIVWLAGYGHRYASFFSTFSMPWVVAILLMIGLVATRRMRTALGVAIGLGTVLAVCVAFFLLLVQGLSNNFN